MTYVFVSVILLNIAYCLLLTFTGQTSIAFEVMTAVPIALVNAVSTWWLWNGGKFRR
jgi:hypothetical protein